MDISDYDYSLPKERIALYPKSDRSSSKLFIIDRAKDAFEHKVFSDIIDYLQKGDLLVLNNSKVFPARLHGYKKGTGGKAEIFLLKKIDGGKWEALVRPGRRLQPGTVVEIADEKIVAYIGERTQAGGRVVEFSANGDLMDLIWQYGEIPLPPYIDRQPEEKDKSTYQTVYAKNIGAAAAPTAGFHFTDEILHRLTIKGIEIAYLTLHPGLGTFRPIKVQDVAEHKMDEEFFSIPEKTADMITDAKKQGRRIIAVGTTAVRALESSFDDAEKRIIPTSGRYTDKFIYPPYQYKIVDCLSTNFHLPKSTLLLLVSALAGRERMLAAYKEAIRLNYRFFSYGDAMLIL
ncbi:MAG: tRNA preQ1(34) S-adenosylmethionine ribosyltransferase-isomerase QueA [candidate division Zixibacteria bacterium]|nr:tRNA preQ1(34) S-adenosylmethionine ribosyltransferase-isomerase QueA [candidate division Zixibacteria bacterium]